jgi:hypothetical protein
VATQIENFRLQVFWLKHGEVPQNKTLLPVSTRGSLSLGFSQVFWLVSSERVLSRGIFHLPRHF